MPYTVFPSPLYEGQHDCQYGTPTDGVKKELKKLPAVGDYTMTGSLNELCEKIENVKTGEMNRIRSAGRAAMDLSKYDGKHVRVTDKWGETFMGMAEYAGCDFLECEYGGEEDGIFIEDSLIYRSQIVSIAEMEVHGTVNCGRKT